MEGVEFWEGAQECEVVEIAEVVELLVRVFDCDFDCEGVVEVVVEDCVVEAGAVAAPLERGKDYELRDSRAAGEGGLGRYWQRKCEIESRRVRDALF